MNELYSFISNHSEPVTVKIAALSLLLAFGLAQLIGAVYVRTFKGMSYSRSFVQAVALGSIISCMLMLAINNSIAAGLGIAGSLAIIRFRTSMRDPRDMVFVFASMGAGIAAGLKAYMAAVFGTALFCAAVYMLAYTEFGSKQQFDGLLRFSIPRSTDGDLITNILRRYTRQFTLITLRNSAQEEVMEHAYQVEMKDQELRVQMVGDLEELPGLQEISLLMQEPTVEL